MKLADFILYDFVFYRKAAAHYLTMGPKKDRRVRKKFPQTVFLNLSWETQLGYPANEGGEGGQREGGNTTATEGAGGKEGGGKSRVTRSGT